MFSFATINIENRSNCQCTYEINEDGAPGAEHITSESNEEVERCLTHHKLIN